MDDQEYEHYEQSEEDFVVEMVDLDGLEEFEELDRFDDSIEGEDETWRETPRDAGQAVISQSSRLPAQTPPVVRVSLRSRLTIRARQRNRSATSCVRAA